MKYLPYQNTSIRQIDLDILDNYLMYHSKNYVHLMSGHYSLTIGETRRLKSIYDSLAKVDNILINNALVWFDMYSTEVDHPRKLIYLAIVIETLLSESTGALTHKLSCRMANLLESDFDRKIEIYENINDFYSTRSAILHGTNKSFDDLKQTDGYVRKMILKVVKVIATIDRQKSFKDQYNSFLRRQDFGIN